MWGTARLQKKMKIRALHPIKSTGQDELLVIQSALSSRLEWIKTSTGGAAGHEDAA